MSKYRIRLGGQIMAEQTGHDDAMNDMKELMSSQNYEN